MDNKKWSKKFSTIFWWVLAFLPLFCALISFIGYNFAHLNSITNTNDIIDYFKSDFNDFTYYLENLMTKQGSFEYFIPNFLFNMYDNLFFLIVGPEVEDFLAYTSLFAWATWIFIIHVIFDIIVWLPCFLHDLIDRFKK